MFIHPELTDSGEEVHGPEDAFQFTRLAITIQELIDIMNSVYELYRGKIESHRDPSTSPAQKIADMAAAEELSDVLDSLQSRIRDLTLEANQIDPVYKVLVSGDFEFCVAEDPDPDLWDVDHDAVSAFKEEATTNG